MTGRLAGVEPGTLAHYTYEERSTDSEGNQETTYYHFTVGICSVPESAHKTSELICQRRFGFRFIDGFEDVVPHASSGSRSRARLMDKRFETFADAERGLELAAPALLPHLHRLARRAGAEELRVRAGRRRPRHAT